MDLTVCPITQGKLDEKKALDKSRTIFSRTRSIELVSNVTFMNLLYTVPKLLHLILNAKLIVILFQIRLQAPPLPHPLFLKTKIVLN